MRIDLDSISKLVVTVIVLISCFAGEWWALTHANAIAAESQMIIGRVLGTMDSLLVGVVFYWVGSSASAATKDKAQAEVK